MEHMFLGEFTHTVDEKGRVTIPSRFRADMAQGIVITRGFDGCLTVYPLDEWKTLAKRVSALPITDRSARDFRRFVFASACDAAPDRQGRVLIPSRLLEYAHIDDQVVIVGMNTYLEIWSPDSWGAVCQNVEDDDANAERWLKLEI